MQRTQGTDIVRKTTPPRSGTPLLRGTARDFGRNGETFVRLPGRVYRQKRKNKPTGIGERVPNPEFRVDGRKVRTPFVEYGRQRIDGAKANRRR